MAVGNYRGKNDQNIGCAVVTVSDSRTEATDTSGKLAIRLIDEAGHRTISYEVVPDQREAIVVAVEKAALRKEASAVILTGGTGVAGGDVTIEAVQSLFVKDIPGFGEIFRMLSYEEIGSAAMMSRSAAGIYHGKAVFALPGSPGAVRLAMEKLILPELPHLVYELRKE